MASCHSDSQPLFQSVTFGEDGYDSVTRIQGSYLGHICCESVSVIQLVYQGVKRARPWLLHGTQTQTPEEEALEVRPKFVEAVKGEE